MSAGEKTPLTKEQDGGPPPEYSQGEYQPPEYSQGDYQATKKPTVMFSPQAASYTPDPLTGTIPDDYLILSLLTIFFCFWPLGIVALLKSLEVRSAIARGDLFSAQIASRSAHKFNKLSIILGIISFVITLGIVLLCQLVWIV